MIFLKIVLILLPEIHTLINKHFRITTVLNFRNIIFQSYYGQALVTKLS